MTIPGPGTYEFDIVGESNYQPHLLRICGGKKRRDGVQLQVTAVLILEDSNPYDSNAVRVEIHGQTVGYLDRNDARTYRQKLKEAGHPRLTAYVNAMVVGGWKRSSGSEGYFGVKLDLPTEPTSQAVSDIDREVEFEAALESLDRLISKTGQVAGKIVGGFASVLGQVIRSAPTWPGRFDRFLISLCEDGELTILLWFLRGLACVGLAALLAGVVWWLA